MRSDSWPTVKLGGLAREITVGHVGPMMSEYVEQGIPFLRSQDIAPYRILTNQIKRIGSEFHAKLKKSKLCPGDVVIVRTGKPGTCAVVPESLGEANCADLVIVRLSEALNPDFFSYYMNGAAAQHVLIHSVGAVQQHFNVGAARNMPVPCPAREVQDRVAGILKTLDDKIELNSQTSKTLEELARSIFKAWFIDFLPVEAKAAGATSFPGMSDGTFAKFPSEFVTLPSGEVPKGWQLRSVYDAFEINPPRSLKIGVDATYLDMKNMPTTGPAAPEWTTRTFTGSGMRFTQGDTLVARITPCLENGKTAFVDFMEDGEIAWGSTEYVVMRPREPLPAHFAYLLAREETFRTFAVQNMSGTSGRQRFNSGSLKNYMIAVPPEEIARAFSDATKPLMDAIAQSAAESRPLALSRDLLLRRFFEAE